jgi:glycosyltransferase involved in cell wall biosynthesis
MIKDKVCLVVPLYNKEKYILNTLQSVLKNHGYDNFECIVVDDESTDGSSVIAQNFCKEHNDKFTYVRIQHKGKRGPSNARNIGIRLADGEFICFLDADDEICEGFIQRAVEAYSEKDIDLYIENLYCCWKPNEPVFNTYKYSGMIVDSKQWLMDSYFFGNGYHPVFACAMYKTDRVKSIPFKDINAEDFVFLNTHIFYSKNIYFNTEHFAYKYNICYREQNTTQQSEYKDDITWFAVATDNIYLLTNCEFYWKVVWENDTWRIVDNV